MSSFVSIVNDSPHPWHCKYIERNGTPIMTITWATMASTVIGAVTAALAISPALTIGTGGSALDDIKSSNIYGVPKHMLVPSATPSVAGVTQKPSHSRFSDALADNIAKYLDGNKYVLLNPSDQIKAGTGKTLNMDCKRIESVENYATITTMRMDTNGVNVYRLSIAEQLPRHLFESIRGFTDPPKRALEEVHDLTVSNSTTA